jgi:hypothetical protein
MLTNLRARSALFAGAAALALIAGTSARAADAAPAADAGAATDLGEVIVTATKTTRSSVAISGEEAQKILPGISPLKAIQTLPGVLYETADPWGNNEQNLALVVHGFTTQQLGYTFDGVPLGDQQYGNYNGLSPSRALSSENVSHVTLSSGAGALGVASASNLGAVIETYSRDPAKEMGGDARATFGDFMTQRYFLRFDTGEHEGAGAAFISYLHHDQRAWDFNGHQKGDQVNLKYVFEDDRGRLTLYADWNNKVEPNEDAVAFGNQQTATSTYFPYTRAFIYPDIAGCIAYLTGGPGTPPPIYGNNFSNCFSAAQRQDILGYAQYDFKISPTMTWSNQVYYHYDYGRGIVAGPINQAGLPALFATYFPQLVVGGSATSAGSLTNLSNLFGGTGYEVRTTEYRINRPGLRSTFNWSYGQHDIEAGLWFEHNEPAQHRVWYPFSAANNDLSPYDIPRGFHVLTQYYNQFFVNDLQLHLQDQWRIRSDLTLQFGDKASLQNASNDVIINQKNLPTVAQPVVFPTGHLNTREWFLPQAGFLWDATEHEQVFGNVQKNLRQFIAYGAGSNFFGFSPWSLGTQAAFDLFKTTVSPETSITYELGIRTKRKFDNEVVTGVQGQFNLYHVDFSNRLLNVAPYNFINPAPAILVNVGGVTTNGADLAATFELGPHVSLYDAISYNKSTYDSSYSSGISAGNPVIVPTAGKYVPLEPKWMNKTIVSANWGNFEAQLIGDYVGSRYVTYTNDLSVPSTFVTDFLASYVIDLNPATTHLRFVKVSLNVVNLADKKGISTAVVTSASGGYQAYPIAPRMAFVTLEAGF